MHDPDPVEWWRTAVMYEVYLRSFADGSGDGIGDLIGLRSRLPYLRDLGVDGIWITPWFASPMKDGGYDVSDYTAIDPLFGTLDDARAVVEEAHALGLRVIVDFVANHTSDEHPWFQEALAGDPGGPARARYHFRRGRGPTGELPPNDWISAFGGGAWTRVGGDGEWYLHLFSPGQPDLNWEDADVRRDFEGFIRFWLDLGLDGLRIDAASALAKRSGLPDFGFGPGSSFHPVSWVGSPMWDVDEVHELLRSWRRIADEYEGDRMLVGEVVVNGAERLARYMRPDELHTTFNLDFLKAPLEVETLRGTVAGTLAAFRPVGAPATWALSNHDETRHATRYGRSWTGVPLPPPYPFPPSDPDLGTRRARAMLLVMLALPGSAYLYQGEELGLQEVEDLRDEDIHDPSWTSSGGAVRGRDGCRVPMPWSGTAPPFGFTGEGVRPWLPQPAGWADRTVDREAGDPASMLELYRRALRLRRSLWVDASEEVEWLPAAPGVLAFTRQGGGTCILNLSGNDLPVDTDRQVLCSTPSGVLLPADGAMWISRAG